MNTTVLSQRVKDVMSSVVITIDSEHSLHEALVMMEEHGLSALPVCDGRGRCVGILSASDIIHIARELDDDLTDAFQLSDVSRAWLVEMLASESAGQRKVASVMKTDVNSVLPNDSLSHAAREILRHRVHRLPVIDKEHRLVGILSTMDFVAAFAEAAQ